MGLAHERLLGAVSVALSVALQSSFVGSAAELRRCNNCAGASIVPYLTLLVNCTVWGLYAGLRGDTPLLLSNTVGVGVGIGCCWSNHFYSILRAPFWYFLAAGATAICGLALAACGRVEMEGNLAVGLSICIYAAPLADLRRVIKEQSTEAMPFAICLGNLAGSVTWTFYGLVVRDVRVTLPSLIGVLLASLQMAIFATFGFVSTPARPSRVTCRSQRIACAADPSATERKHTDIEESLHDDINSPETYYQLVGKG